MPSERWLQLKAPSGTCPRREPACSQMLWGRALTLLFSCGGPGWCLLPTEGRSICLGNLLDGAAAFMGPLSGASGHLLRLPHQLLRPHLHSDAVETLLSWSLSQPLPPSDFLLQLPPLLQPLLPCRAGALLEVSLWLQGVLRLG